MHLKTKRTRRSKKSKKIQINEILFFISIVVLIVTFFIIKFKFGEFVFLLLSFIGLILMIPNYYIDAKRDIEAKKDNYWMIKFYGYIALVFMWFVALIIVAVRTFT